MDRNTLMLRTALLLVGFVLAIASTSAQEAAVEPPAAENQPAAEAAPAVDSPSEEASPAAVEKPDAAAVAAANAAFQTKFNEYKAAVRSIEKLRSDYQAANEADRKKLNEQLTGQIAHAQSLVNAMVDAATEAYRLAPNADPELTKLLVAVARYNTIGRQIGPGEESPDAPGDKFYPVDGGDQYEQALPLIKLLIDSGADEKQLPIWGFLAAFMTNDYELATQYLATANESGALEELGKMTQKSDSELQEAGLVKMVAHQVGSLASVIDEYQQLWAKESAIRADEAKADDLPRVKLTTNKGEITIELFENQAPQSVANFLTLVKQGFYNGTPFHRVLPFFMAQGGDPTGEGTGGPGYSIRGEASVPNHRMHFRGTLSMAHSGHPDSGGSQFFLTFVPTPHLNGRHTAFGRVIEGIEVLGDIQRRSPQHQQNPPPADKILKAEVVRERPHEYAFDKLPDR
jgi:cyclophilin family peptidyl-prolyl cis-trans isomerase